MKPIRHVNQLGTRVREQGRLRMGVKTGNAMKALKHWRFTSPEQEPLAQLAQIYGGTVEPWSDAKAGQGANQFQLLSRSEKIQVIIPPGGLSTWYEEWAGGGIKRRCDGETVWVDGDESKPQPCICSAKQQMACKPKTRLSVVLPQVRPFGGVWRLDTGSWNAADEMTAMENMLASMQIDGLVEAQLLIEERQKMKAGKKSKFVVPVILISSSAQGAITAGQDSGHLLAVGPATDSLALGTGESTTGHTAPHLTVVPDEVIDAQIVDLPGYDRDVMDARLATAMTTTRLPDGLGIPDLSVGLCLGASGGNTRAVQSLSDTEHNKAVGMAEQLAQGKRKVLRIENERLILG